MDMIASLTTLSVFHKRVASQHFQPIPFLP
jgi:hypothetical protein